jgi:streptomycin 6-kinase
LVKLHLFSGFENARLGIEKNTQLGHLYSDWRHEELLEAGRELGINPGALQCSRGFYHFDLWGEPLKKACSLHKIVGNHEIFRDMRSLDREAARI